MNNTYVVRASAVSGVSLQAIAAQRKNPKNKYLELAIKDVLKGRMPFTPRTAAPGCLITRAEKKKSTKQATYSSDIARIVQDNCQQCHRAKQVGPFPLTSYEKVRGWSAMIYSVIEEGRMPPWNAHADFDGVFANQRKIPDEDKELLMGWIRDGMPHGNPEDDPPAKEWSKGWRIGKPDKVFTMQKNFRVPAEGVGAERHLSFGQAWPGMMWVLAIVPFVFLLGYVIGLPLYVFAYLKVHGQGWLLSGALSLGTLAVVYLGFVKILGVLLPVLPVGLS